MSAIVGSTGAFVNLSVPLQQPCCLKAQALHHVDGMWVYRPLFCHQQGIEAACKRLSLAQNVADAGVFVELGFGKRAQRNDFEVFLARKRD